MNYISQLVSNFFEGILLFTIAVLDRANLAKVAVVTK